MIYSRLCEKCLSWIDEDLSLKSKDEREKLYENYKWMFSNNSKVATLEPLIIGNDPRVNSYRAKFKEWFGVVCDYSLSPKHFGETSYSHYLKDPYWLGAKSKGNKAYPQRVILSLGMMGIFTGVKTNYLNVPDKALSHGRIYSVDVEKLKDWTMTTTEDSGGFSESSWSGSVDDLTWATTSSDDFDYSFLEGDDIISQSSWESYTDWFSQRQHDTIVSLCVIPEALDKAQDFLDTLPFQMVNVLSDNAKKKFRSQYRNCKWLVNLNKRKVGTCKVDDKGGRFYSMMVGMGKDYRRNCVTLDGERVVEVDLSSAQPTLIGMMVKKETGKKTQWLSHCLAGDFYEWVKSVTGTKVQRDKVKKYVMRYLFSCYGSDLPGDYQGEHLPSEEKDWKKGYKRFDRRLTSFLKENEPEVYTLIESHKRYPYWSEKTWTDCWKKTRKGRWCSSLPVQMQKEEVGYIKACLTHLPEDMKFFTIHDAICVKESEGAKVKEIMESVSLEKYGEKISVKIENGS